MYNRAGIPQIQPQNTQMSAFRGDCSHLRHNIAHEYSMIFFPLYYEARVFQLLNDTLY